MNYGVKKCVWTALGDVTANIIQATLVIFVIGSFISDNPKLLNIFNAFDNDIYVGWEKIVNYLDKNKEIIGYLRCQGCSWTKADMIEDEQVHDFVEQARDVVEITLERQLKNRKV